MKSASNVETESVSKPVAKVPQAFFRFMLTDQFDCDMIVPKNQHSRKEFIMDQIFKAKWIRPSFEEKESACEFLRTFSTKKKVTRATLFVSALGVYAARVNGKKVSYVLAPGWTSYHKRVQYQEYDVTALIGTENILSITAAPGWRMPYAALDGKGIADYNTDELSSTEYAIIAALAIRFEDGTEDLLITDESWTAKETKWRACHIYNGDVYDVSFEGGCFPVKVLALSKSILVPQEGEIICEHEHLKPTRIIHTPKGETVLDFGQNMTGYLSLFLTVPAGARAVIDHAEVLDHDGNFYNDNYRSAKAQIVFIGDGNRHEWKPEFTFYGFRYIRLTEWHGEVNPDDFTAIVVHSDIERTGYFECSDAKINQLYHNIIWGQKSNFLDVPTDCPQRDERLGWTGDAQVFARCAGYNFNVDRFFRKWLSDQTLDQRHTGVIPHVTPNIGLGSASHGWADSCIIIPWQMYLLYGDKNLLARQYVTMKRWIDYMYREGDAYIRSGKHYGDWLAHDTDTNQCNGATSKWYLGYAFRAYSTSLLIKISKILGMEEKELSDYEAKYEETKERIYQDYYKDGMLAIDPLTQTGLVIALQFELCPKGTEAAHAEKLAQMIHENGDRLTTGFLGTPYLLHVLTKYGYADLAYTLLFQNKMPSWLFSVEHGATTMWEHWDGVRDDGTLWSESMNSFNHYAYGAVGDWLYGTVAGIETDEAHPGFEHIIFRPVTTDRLTFAKASLKTRYGTIASEWHRTGEKTEYTFTVPSGLSATAYLDGKTYELSEGTHSIIQ